MNEESEKDTEKFLVQQVELLGGLCRKFVSPGHRNVPDRLCFMPDGKLILIEVKSEGDKPRIGQLNEIARLRDLGFSAYVCETKNQVMETLKKELG